MKFAITGANGFIGKHVVAEALTQGHSAVALTRQAKESYLASFLVEHKKINIDNLDIKECDLNDKKTLTESIDDCDTVIHLAASISSHIAGEKPDGKRQYQQTLDTTNHVIEAINSSNINTLVLVSSISVLDYVNQTADSIIDEETPLCNRDNDIGDYARMKRDQEKLCQQWQLETGKQLIIVRPGLVYSDEELSDAHAGFIKKGLGIAAIHHGQVPLIKVNHVSEIIIGIFNRPLYTKELFHLIGKPPVLQIDYLEQLKRQGKLRFYLPLPWKAYSRLTKAILWILTKANKQDKIPDSFHANSVAARQKPFVFNSEKINNFIK
ncbi:MAG: nucleoside-diphosphate-sugar epimerase [Cellvibrionaceae bacterium]|jgi:nucleoside-diphosphate-sugar epimerase